MWVFDAELLSRQLVRALRGKRSQTALSRRLGYRSNVVYMWESGRRSPASSDLFRILSRTGRDAIEAMRGFAGGLEHADLCSAAGVTALINALRGQGRIVDVAERCGVSRFTASRWLKGTTEPRLPELLTLIEALSFRVVDFVAAIVPPESVPLIEARWRELEARRVVAFTHPWSQAILRALETTDYAALERHEHGWLARRLNIEPSIEEESLDALERAGLVRWVEGRFVAEPVALDTSFATDEQRRQLKLHWSDVGRVEIDRGSEGLFSWAVIALSREDFTRLQELHVSYMRALRQLVDASGPSEVVAVANVQLFQLRPALGR